MNLISMFCLFVAVRLCSVFIVRTYYVPDEYWQSLEVAHKLTFGYGHLTWEWIQGIRSYIYPLIFAGVYKILQLLQLDTVQSIILLPRILQAILSGFADYRLYIWTGKRKWAIFIILIQFFWFYTATRTLANTFETALTTIALSYFPWQYKESTNYLWIVCLCCYIRPTAAIVWLPLCLYHLNNTRLSVMELFLKRFVMIGITVGTICVGIDSQVHGKLLISPLEFIRYNYFNDVGSFYGTHQWYWYFLTGLPTILGINFLPFLFGSIQTIRYQKVYSIRKMLLTTIGISLVLLSSIKHKEFRFILILLPLCLYICIDTLARWSYKRSRSVIWVTAIIILAGNVIPAWYLSVVHQKGPIDTMEHLSNIAANYKDENKNSASFLFLMPCHSTPYYSHIHQNISMRFLTCEPNLKQHNVYIDEADQFYTAPQSWLRSHLPSYPRTALPTHVILFDSLADTISDFLQKYDVIKSIDHSEYYGDRQGKQILIYERISLKNEQNLFNHEEDSISEYAQDDAE